MIQEGADSCTLGRIYVAMVQSVMVYRLETWFMTPRIGMILGKFHHRVACRLTGRQPWIGWDDVWVYVLLEKSLAEAGLQEVKTYVSRLHNTVSQLFSTWIIMYLCLAAVRSQGKGWSISGGSRTDCNWRRCRQKLGRRNRSRGGRRRTVQR